MLSECHQQFWYKQINYYVFSVTSCEREIKPRIMLGKAAFNRKTLSVSNLD